MVPNDGFFVAQEVNADAIKWGSLLLSYRFAGSIHTGTALQDGISSVPAPDQLITAMSEDTLTTVFIPREGLASPNTAYIFVIDKRLQLEEADLPPRKITLTLNKVVVKASVVPPGRRTGLQRRQCAREATNGNQSRSI